VCWESFVLRHPFCELTILFGFFIPRSKGLVVFAFMKYPDISVLMKIKCAFERRSIMMCFLHPAFDECLHPPLG
jgi:hypothetical protein